MLLTAVDYSARSFVLLVKTPTMAKVLFIESENIKMG